MKFVYFIFFVVLFSPSCTPLEIPEKPDDEDVAYEKILWIYDLVEKSQEVKAVWPSQSTQDTLTLPMYGNLSFEELSEDFIFATNSNLDSLIGVIDISNNKSVIGWSDTNGDNENY